jgi:hypothetical protein
LNDVNSDLNLNKVVQFFGESCRQQVGSTLQAPPVIVRFTESGGRGWQAVSGGTPESGNLPPGLSAGRGCYKLKDPRSEWLRYFSNTKVNTEFLLLTK